MLLAFDTATPAVTVALHDGERVVASSTVVGGMRHGELLAPGIVAVLERAGAVRQDVTAVAVGVGPGPFTGLRVGLVTARTLGLALGVPVHGVCTLDVLAAEAVDPGLTGGVTGGGGVGSVGGDGFVGGFVVATDARRKEVYLASYDGQGRRLHGPSVSRPAEVATDLPAVGAGALLYPDAFTHPVGPAHPDAGVLAAMVAAGRAELLDPDPLYLRRPDIAAPVAPKPVS